jgi:small-conductance mechanosensitive channel
MTNLSQFKIRHFDLYVSVAYHEDLALVKEVLLSLVEKQSACLDDPEPMIVMEGFGESGVNLRLAVWAT